MLEGLDAVDWAALRHAYGPADDVPQLLCEIASGDKGECRLALLALFGNIYHQGTVNEATSYTVPFLLELAARDNQRARDTILLLLGRIATGTSSHAVNEDGDEELQEELSWVRASREAVARGIDLFERRLEDEDEKVRLIAAIVLSSFPERGRAALERRLEVERDLLDQLDVTAGELGASSDYLKEVDEQVWDKLERHLEDRDNLWELDTPLINDGWSTPRQPSPLDEKPDLDPGIAFEDLDTWQRGTLEKCVARLHETGWMHVRDWHNFVRSAGSTRPTPLMVARRFRDHIELGLELWFYDERAARLRGVLEGKPYIRLRVGDKEDAVAMGARLYFGERVEEVLEAIIAHQSTLDLDTYQAGLMAELEPICDEIIYDELEILGLVE